MRQQDPLLTWPLFCPTDWVHLNDMLTRRTDPKIAFGVLALGVAAVVLALWVITSTGVARGAPPAPGGGAATNSGIPELQASLNSHELANAARLADLEVANVARAAGLQARIETLEAANAARESALQDRIDALEAANAVRTQAVQDDIDALRPRQLSYRVRLVDVNGIPIGVGKRLTFTIFADEAKTQGLWTHSADVYPDYMGYYDIVFGEEAGNPLPATVFEGPARYLAVSVGDDLPALLPPEPGTPVEIPLQTIYPIVPTHRLESNFDTMLNQAFPDVELGLSLCATIDGSVHGGGFIDGGFGVAAEAKVDTSVSPVGAKASKGGFFDIGGLAELVGGITIDGSGCLETAFPVPVPVLPDASGQALGAPAGFEPLDIVGPLTAAGQQIRTTPERLEDAVTIITGLALDPHPVDPIAHIRSIVSVLPSPGNLDSFILAPELAPGSLLDLDLECDGPIDRPLGNLLDEICALAASDATQALFRTISEIKTGVDTVQSTVDTGVTFLDGRLTTAKNAIDAEITAAEAFVDGKIRASIDRINGEVNAAKLAIDTEITAAEIFVDGKIRASIDRINGEVNTAKLAIDGRIATAETFVVGKVTEINDASLVVERALADGIRTEITSARDNVNTTVAGVQSTANAINGKVNDIKGPFPAGQSYSFHIHGNLENRARELQGSISSVFEQAAAANSRLASDVQPKLQTVLEQASAANLRLANDVQPKLETVRASVINDLQPKVSNIQFVLGTERPVDTRFNNGAQPVSFWAFHGWGNAVNASTEARNAHNRADRAASIAERICSAIQSSPIKRFRCST